LQARPIPPAWSRIRRHRIRDVPMPVWAATPSPATGRAPRDAGGILDGVERRSHGRARS
jgi:hypothetical protein